MPSRRMLEKVYGKAGADLLEAFPTAQIAMHRNEPIHVHFRDDATVDDRALGFISRMPEMKEIVANDTGITDAGLAQLIGLTKLEILHLAGTALTDAAAAVSTQLSWVLVMDLSRTSMTEAGLVGLRGMPALRRLWIIDCGLTPESIGRVRAALSPCRVIHEPVALPAA